MSEQLLKELKRAMDPHYNKTEPPSIVTVVKVYSNSADVKYTFKAEDGTIQNVVDRKVPILKSCWESGTLTLHPGDEVMLAYVGGSASNAYIIGKL